METSDSVDEKLIHGVRFNISESPRVHGPLPGLGRRSPVWCLTMLWSSPRHVFFWEWIQWTLRYAESLSRLSPVLPWQHTFQQVMSPRGSAQASRTGDDTKISHNDVSKRDPYSGALRDSALLVLIMLCKICYESQTKYCDAEAQFLFFIAVCFLNICGYP